MPDISISQSFFQFGECPVNQNRDIAFCIENFGDNAVEIKIDKYFYFHVEPSLAIIPKGKKIDFTASFYPKSAGINF